MNRLAIHTVAGRVAAVVAQAQAIPSPCVSVCAMDAATGLCGGCLRQLDEIASWSRMDDDDKREVWIKIGQRAQQLLDRP